MDERNIKLSDLAKGIVLDDLSLKNPVVVPNNEFRELLDKVIERGSLEEIGSRKSFYINMAVFAFLNLLFQAPIIQRMKMTPEDDVK